MKRYLISITVGLTILVIMAAVTRVKAAIELISFDATPDPSASIISLTWETGSEYEITGFYIQRSVFTDTAFTRLIDQVGNDVFIPAFGDLAGHYYSHDDTDVDWNVRYYYRLEIIENGSPTFSDVISAQLENTPTPSATLTAISGTPTNTPTPTATYTSSPRTPTPTSTFTTSPGTRTPTSTPSPSRTSTAKPTATRTRTPTYYHASTNTSPPHPTSTPSETSTVTSTPTVSPTVTTTLAPLPSLTLLFPYHTNTPTFTPSPSITPSPIPPSPSPTPIPENHISLQFSFLTVIIILLWVTLAGFLFVYIRKVT